MNMKAREVAMAPAATGTPKYLRRAPPAAAVVSIGIGTFIIKKPARGG
jgi:hypothetical protein